MQVTEKIFKTYDFKSTKFGKVQRKSTEMNFVNSNRTSQMEKDKIKSSG